MKYLNNINKFLESNSNDMLCDIEDILLEAIESDTKPLDIFCTETSRISGKIIRVVVFFDEINLHREDRGLGYSFKLNDIIIESIKRLIEYLNINKCNFTIYNERIIQLGRSEKHEFTELEIDGWYNLELFEDESLIIDINYK